MEENTLKNYLYDYQKSSFKIKNYNDDTIYYLNVDHNYIEVNEEIFKVFKSSYDKLRYTYKQEIANSVSHYEDIDLATSFFIKKIVSKIIEFLLLPIKYFYKIIKKLFFKPVSFVIINITKSSTKLWKKTTKILERNKTIKNNVKN